MPDFLDLLRSLNDRDVKFVVVGGYATMMHGSSTVTFDLDLAVALDQSNGAALIEALAPFRPYPPQFGSPDQFVWDQRSLIGAVMSLNTSAGHIDILRVLPEVDSFEGLHERSKEVSVQGVLFKIASIEDLISMKTAANRPRDKDHIEMLKAIKAEMEASPSIQDQD